MAIHYLEDLAAGQHYRTGLHQLDANRIKTFAAEFDPQPFHMDEIAATRFHLSRIICQRMAHRRVDYAIACGRRVPSRGRLHRRRYRGVPMAASGAAS